MEMYKSKISSVMLGLQMSRHAGKPTICIGENKGADQLRSNCEADQRLCFRYSDSTIPLLLKSEISSFLLFSVTVQAGLRRTCSETTLLDFRRGGSNDQCITSNKLALGLIRLGFPGFKSQKCFSCRSVEKKYGDQIKALQSELDKERENSNSVAAKHQQSLDSEMEELRQEEGKLRDQLLDALKVLLIVF